MLQKIESEFTDSHGLRHFTSETFRSILFCTGVRNNSASKHLVADQGNDKSCLWKKILKDPWMWSRKCKEVSSLIKMFMTPPRKNWLDSTVAQAGGWSERSGKTTWKDQQSASFCSAAYRGRRCNKMQQEKMVFAKYKSYQSFKDHKIRLKINWHINTLSTMMLIKLWFK